MRSGVLKFTDMADDPDKFFLAHRLLSTVGLGGFGIRFTVQFNLFAGSIVGLAGPDQRAMLDEFQRAGDLGCFLLTERQAGVLSGLIVETTATWNDDAQAFELHDVTYTMHEILTAIREMKGTSSITGGDQSKQHV